MGADQGGSAGRLRRLYDEAGELLRARDPWRAAERVGQALLELEGIRAARGGSRALLRRAIPPAEAQAEDLAAAAERLRALAREVRREVDRLEAERRTTGQRRRLQRSFAAEDGQGACELDRDA